MAEILQADPVNLMMVLGCILVMTFGVLIFLRKRGANVRFGDKEISIGGKGGPEPTGSLGQIIAFIVKITDINAARRRKLEAIGEEHLSEQLQVARKRMNAIRNDFLDEYKALFPKEDADLAYTSIQMFGLLAGRDFEALTQKLESVIRKNHLSEKSSEEFKDYLEMNARADISELRWCCSSYSGAVDQERSAAAFDNVSGRIFRAYEESLNSAKIISERKRKDAEEVERAALKEKEEAIRSFFPSVSPEDAERFARAI